MRRAAKTIGFDATFSASPLASFAEQVGSADAVLAGAHLGGALSAVHAQARAHGVPVAVLPADIAQDREGIIALGIARDLVSRIHLLKGTIMATRTVTVASSHGLHARPAKLFSEAAKNSGLSVTIAKGDGKAVNAASILGVISLGANTGDVVTLTVEGENAEGVLDQLAGMLETDQDA
jgi:phosphocarrier protein